MEALYKQGMDVIMNTYSRYPIVLAEGKGCRVTDENGKEYLDFTAGFSVSALGHGHEALCRAIAEQAKKMIHASNVFWTKPQIALAQRLVDVSCFDRVFFCNSGAEAMEACLKLARKYASENYAEQNPGRFEVISALNSFHGRTFGALTATGQEKYHKGMGPLLPGAAYVPYNDFAALKAAAGPNTCAVVLEVLQCEGGFHVADGAYLANVRKLCDENDVMLIFDEVQTGVGRTGTFFAFEQFKQYGVEPDAAALAKGLAGGVPIGAMLAKEKFAAAFSPGDHASTFGGNPLACAAGGAMLNELYEGGVLAGVKAAGDYLAKRLKALAAKHGAVKDVRGLGLAQGMELDTEAAPVIRACIEKGLLLIGAGPKVIRFVPPLIVTKEQIDEGMDILDCVLGKEGSQ